ncbi:hypothetical protein DL770_003858 [Monosporascus sp. CRB-9-2]|nr:hypothetical protein DL770_003858 [Monosporascus sp. CRB-9-2]
MQGSLSHTLVAAPETTISFRVAGTAASLGVRSKTSPKSIHRDLTPSAGSTGTLAMPKAKRSLCSFSLPCIPGETRLNSFYTGQSSALKLSLNMLITLLIWQVDQVALREIRADNKHELDIIRASEKFPYLRDTITELQEDRDISLLFSDNWPQVISHGDLSELNMLLDETTLSINRIIDWSLARMRPFGMELSTLRRTSGNMNGHGRSNYTCHDTERRRIEDTAELPCKLEAILGYTLTKNPDGTLQNVLVPKPLRYFQEWLQHPWSKLVLRPSDAQKYQATHGDNEEVEAFAKKKQEDPGVGGADISKEPL